MLNSKAYITAMVSALILVCATAIGIAIFQHTRINDSIQDFQTVSSENLTWQFVQLRNETRNLRDAVGNATLDKLVTPSLSEIALPVAVSRYDALHTLIGKVNDDRVPPAIRERLHATHERFTALVPSIQTYFAAPTEQAKLDLLTRLDQVVVEASQIASLMLQTEQEHITDLRQSMVDRLRGYEITVAAFVGFILMLTGIMGWMLQKEVRANRDLANAIARAASAASAKSMFLSSMSHELRTPLNAISGFSQLLVMQMPEEQKTQSQDYLNMVDESVRSLVQLIDQILEFDDLSTNDDHMVLSGASVTAVVEAATAAARHWHPNSKVPVHFDAPPKHLKLITDAEKLQMALAHLISNAIKFNTEGGEVRIRAEPGKNTILFKVEDTGIGIAPEKAAFLFRPFERLGLEAGAISGSGTGLAIAKLLATRLHGKIGYSDRRGDGSLFWLEVPIDMIETVSTNIDVGEVRDARGVDLMQAAIQAKNAVDRPNTPVHIDDREKRSGAA